MIKSGIFLTLLPNYGTAHKKVHLEANKEEKKNEVKSSLVRLLQSFQVFNLDSSVYSLTETFLTTLSVRSQKVYSKEVPLFYLHKRYIKLHFNYNIITVTL